MALIEEEIVLREDGQQWKYSLSDNLDEIKEAIFKRVGIKINSIEDDEWEMSLPGALLRGGSFFTGARQH
jgi:hypothetical protein